MTYEEEHSAIVGRQEVEEVAKKGNQDGRRRIVDKILSCLNEKRDSYSGIVTSIKYLVESQNEGYISLLQSILTNSITNNPMQYGGRMFIAKAVHRLSSEQPEFIAHLFENIINTSSAWSANFLDQREILKILIISLKAIKKAEQVRGTRLTVLTDEFTETLCDRAIKFGDDQTKIDTMVLILESRSSTKPISKKDLITFETLYHDALSLQEPAQRQIFVAQTNKLLLRMRDSYKAVMRDRKKYTEEERDNVRDNYMQFLVRIIRFSFDSIYCNAYFGSFILTISTLRLIIRNITFNLDGLMIKTIFCEKRCYDSVLSCLNDSFEDNKRMALELFFSLPECRSRFSGENLLVLENIVYKLVESVNPAHSLTCLYLFKLIIGLKTPASDDAVIKNQILHRHLSKLTDLVESGVEDTQRNFVRALKRNAIYPKLTCIRALLDEINPKYLGTDRGKWVELSTRIVKSSISACQAVSNVVCNLNPETIGHLPMDLKPVDIASLAEALDVSAQISSDQIETVSSQMLLISGWKTIKECSLSMAAMCSNLWWESKSCDRVESHSEPILKREDIEKIIGFFDHYLRNLRHRGAFEQAYNGFSVVASKIWQEEEYRSRLFSLLQQVMNDFKEEDSQRIDDKRKECLKAYVTRRSAGLPFIIQAILSAESRHDSRTLRFVMENLFEVLQRPTAEIYQKIHCLNILRAIIKDYHLGEKVLSYVGKTLEITMDSFSSESFSIRNCASMLLKATMDRIFGVNRLRDDIHRRNQLSYDKFFQLCPTLHPRMLEILDASFCDRKCLASIHAVFIILFRLKPRLSMADVSSKELIEPFIGPVIEIAYDCPDLKLREISAQLVVKLQNDYEIASDKPRFSGRDKMVQELKDIIYHVSNNRNRLHGALYLTKQWLDEIKSCSDADIISLHLEYIYFAQSSVREILLFIRPDVNNTIKSVALDMAELCIVMIPNQSTFFLDMFPRYKNLLQKKEGFAEPNYESMLFRFTSTMLMAAMHATGRESTEDMAKKLLGEILECISDLVIAEPTITISTNLQASLLRLLRQLLKPNGLINPTSKLTENLMNNLDMDQTFAHVTPRDKLNRMLVDDLGRYRWTSYCGSDQIRQILVHNVTSFSKLFDFRNFSEFKLSDECSKFKPGRSNTPRSIELLAFTIEGWTAFELEHNIIWSKSEESDSDKVKYLTKLICYLPDCDIKCLAVVCLAKLINSYLRGSSLPRIWDSLNEAGRLFEDLCDSDHSYLVRDTCSRALYLYVEEIKLIERTPELRKFLISTMSTIIKLVQDEDHEIRTFCKNNLIKSLAPEDRETRGHMGDLLMYITNQVFNPSLESDVCDCFTLMMRIVFDHSRNYSAELQDKDERLFDKTKLNTFADHIRTIQSCFASLRAFMDRNEGTKIDLDKLHLTKNLKTELSIIDKSQDESIVGDYSWRQKASTQNKCKLDCISGEYTEVTNHQVVTRIMQNLILSLDYFLRGYYNVLIDTEYNFHELSLYRRISFLLFIFECTENTLDSTHFRQVVRERLDFAVSKGCMTTLLYKCIQAISGDHTKMLS